MGPNEADSELTLSVSGSWSAQEWSDFMAQVSTLYDVFLCQHVASQLNNGVEGPASRVSPGSVFLDLDKFVSPSDKLRVARVAAASPGSITFTGIPHAVAAVRDVVLALLNWPTVITLTVVFTMGAVRTLRDGNPDEVRALLQTAANTILALGRYRDAGKLALLGGSTLSHGSQDAAT